MKSLRGYGEERRSGRNERRQSANDTGSRNEDRERNEEIARLLGAMGIDGGDLERYMNLSEDELMHELMVSVHASKQNGTFDPERMRAFASLVAPALSPDRREKLARVIESIEGGEPE